MVSVHVFWRVHRGGCDREAEHFGEAEREHETGKSPRKDLGARGVGRLIDGVVCRVTRPAGSGPVYRGGEGEDGASFGRAGAHWQIRELARMGKLSQDDQEGDEARDPTPELVSVNNLVAKQCYNKRC